MLPFMADAASFLAPSGSATDEQSSFMENKGQWNEPSLFRSGIGGVQVFVERDALTWSWMDFGGLDHHASCSGSSGIPPLDDLKGHAWRMRFQGASPHVSVTGERPGLAQYHFIKGQDPQRWVSHVRSYEAVRYHQLWPGVDLLFHRNSSGFKYDVLLGRSDQVGAVAFQYEGHDGIFLGSEGHLTIVTSMGEVMEMAPVAWYADGRGEAVRCRFTLVGDRVGFEFAPGVDPDRPVVIDPQLLACTLTGMSQFTTGMVLAFCATHDAMGNPIMAGATVSQHYPVTLGAFGQTSNNQSGAPSWSYDIVIGKYSADGTQLLYGTYLGGSNAEYPISIQVAENDELVLYGLTLSSDFPVTANAFDTSFNGMSDMVITRFNQDGSGLVGSTYVGSGNSNGMNGLNVTNQDNYRGEMKLDEQGRIWVVGPTQGPSFPTTPDAYQPQFMNFQNGVIFCMSPDLSTMVHGAYLGTTSADMIYDIAFNAAGEPYVCGATMGMLPTTPGAYQSVGQGGIDAFVVHFSADLSTILHATYVGTPARDEARFIALDDVGDVYIHGHSTGALMEVYPPGIHQDPDGANFFMKLDATLSNRIFSTKVHTPFETVNGTEVFAPIPVAFNVDHCGRLMTSLIFTRPDLQVTPDALWSTGGLYVAVYAPDMVSMLQATYLQGSNHTYGGRGRYDQDGILYLAVCNDVNAFGLFPSTPGAFGPPHSSSLFDAGIYKLVMDELFVPLQPFASPSILCVQDTVHFGQTGVAVTGFWDMGDGSAQILATATSHVYDTPGEYLASFMTVGDGVCTLADTALIVIVVNAPVPVSAAFDLVADLCTSFQVEATATSEPGMQHWWSTGDGAFHNGPELSHVYQQPGGYWITHVVNSGGSCPSSDTVQQWIDILPGVSVAAAFSVELTTDCEGVHFSGMDNSTGIAPVPFWDMGDGTTIAGQQVEHLFAAPGPYTITMVVSDGLSCNITDTAQYVLVVPDVLALQAGFEWSLIQGCGEVTVDAVNTSIGLAPVFQWSTSDGAIYDSMNIVHVFVEPGSHTLTLTVSDSLGCAPSETMDLVVLVQPEVPLDAEFMAEPFGNCSQLMVSITDLSSATAWASTIWDMGDGNTYDQAPGFHAYAAPVTYVIGLTITDTICGTASTFLLEVQPIDAMQVEVVGDTVICHGSSLELLASAIDGTFTWSNGQAGPSLWVDGPGTYTVTVSTEDCQGSVSHTVVAPARLVLGDTLNTCPGRAVHVEANINGRDVLWSNGATTTATWLLDAGDHWLTMVDAWGCQQTDTVHVRTIGDDVALYVPNAFTPDGDGVNDHFWVSGASVGLKEVEVFDRWGRQVWFTQEQGQRWDGTTHGITLPQGVYVYRIRYDHECEAGGREVFGHVTLVR